VSFALLFATILTGTGDATAAAVGTPLRVMSIIEFFSWVYRWEAGWQLANCIPLAGCVVVGKLYAVGEPCGSWQLCGSWRAVWQVASCGSLGVFGRSLAPAAGIGPSA